MSEKSTTTAKPEVKLSLNADKSSLLQRKCDCGNAAGLTGECSGCQQQKLTVQRRARDGGNVGEVPSIVHELLPIQNKLTVNNLGDVYKHEADLTSDRKLTTSRDHSISNHSSSTKEVSEYSNEPKDPIPDSVHRVLDSPGRPLDVVIQRDMGQRFNHDFSRVRVHSGIESDRSAREINAHAYTVKENIVFGESQFAPNTSQGLWLLSHELAHVVQQSSSGTNMLSMDAEGNALEIQADRAADSVVQGHNASTLDSIGTQLQRFPRCRTLLDAPSRGFVSERAVRDKIIDQRRSVAPIEREFPIPAGSATPLRNQRQTIGKDIVGYADIAQLNGTALELIEVKKADWSEAIFAESQLLNYVQKGNRAISKVNQYWREDRKHSETLTSVRGMPASSFIPTSPQRINGEPVSISWCRDGVITFKAIGDKDPEIFLCGVTDRGRIDAFLDKVMGRAQSQIDEFINNEVEGIATQKIANYSVRSVIHLLLSNPKIRQLLPPGVSEDLIVRELQPYESLIRAKVAELLRRAVNELRQMLQAEIRKLLQDSFNALCATVASMTARELLAEFDRQVRKRALQLIPIALISAAKAMLSYLVNEFIITLAEVAELILTVVAYIAALIVVVIVALLVFEVMAAIIAAGIVVVEGIGAAALLSVGEFVTLILAGISPRMLSLA